MWRHTWRERIQLKQRLRALMRWEPRQCKGTFAFLWSKISSRDLILSFSQIHQKYKFMEGSLASRRRKLKSQVYTCILGVFKTWSLVSPPTPILCQVPDIKSSLAMITKLREKKEVNKIAFCIARNFELSPMITFFRLRRQWRPSFCCQSRCTPESR